MRHPTTVLTRVALGVVLLTAAVLRLWRLGQNGFGNEYYTAGVRSMTSGWHNFLYNAFDPAGFVSVDKPPVALWIQVASAKLFGFHGLSVLVSQALEGVGAVWILYHLVQRRFGAPAGLLAGLFLAVTPVSVAVDRSSNTESCLVLVLLLAAWALTRAAEEGSRRLLLLSMALVGVAFNVKMLAAFVVLPAFALVYLLGAGFAWRRRLVDAGAAALVLVVVSLAWIVVYDLTPPERRPYAGTTDTNSIAELVVGPYGVGRFVRTVRPSVAAAGAESGARAAAPQAARERSAEGSRTGYARLFVRVPVGPLRLADGQLAGQVGWLVPFAVMGLIIGGGRKRRGARLTPSQLSLILWLAWVAIYGAVFSTAGGIMHFYYLVLLAPPLAALAAVGVVGLWRWALESGRRYALVVALTFLVTAAWQLHIDADALGGWREVLGASDAWLTWLHAILAGGSLLAASALLAAALRPLPTLARGAVALGVVASLMVPLGWALSSVLVPGPGVLPAADIARLVREGDAEGARVRFIDPPSLATLIGFLQANRGKARYLLATSSVTLAAPIVIQTGEPVMARGGFHGLDPILTPDKLARLAEADELRFVMLGDLSLISRRMGADAAGRPIADWVRDHGKPVDAARWRATDRPTRMTLYDLHPELPLVARP